MNTTETNNILTPIQALHRCLEWFTLHHPTAVLPGTKLPVIQELRNVIVAEETSENAKLKEALEISNGKESRLDDAVELLRRWIEIVNAQPGANKAGILAAVESLLNTSKKFVEHGKEAETEIPAT